MTRVAVVGFSGPPASGKSVLSRGVSEKLGWPRVGFGDYVRFVAAERGLEPSRHALQTLGESLTAAGWEPFCRAVLDHAGWQPGQPLIVDGIRHHEVADTLRALVAPEPFLWIYLQTDEAVRRTRLRERGEEVEQGRAIAAHTTELQVETLLPRLSDVVVDGSVPLKELEADVIKWIEVRTAKLEDG